MQISLGSLLLGSRRWYRVKGLVVSWDRIDGKDMFTSGEAVSRVRWRAKSACLVYTSEAQLFWWQTNYCGKIRKNPR